MNATTAKVLADFATALETREPMQAAFVVCTDWRDAATAKWGEDAGIGAFHFAAQAIADAMASCLNEAA